MGIEIGFPIGIVATATQKMKMVHPEGEMVTAKSFYNFLC